MAKRITLTVYLPSLASGGAERLHINLAPILIEKGYDVTFLVHRVEGAFVPYIPRGVRVIALHCDRTVHALAPLVRYLRREKPDLLLSNFRHSNVIAILSAKLARVSTRVIATQHNAFSEETAQNAWKYKLLPFICLGFLPRMHGIIAVSNSVGEELERMTGLKGRIRVIMNPVVTPDFDARMRAAANHPWLGDNGPPVILAVGRLTRQKGFEILIEAFSRVVKSRPVRLIILGEGPLHAELQAQAREAGMEAAISLPGFHPNPPAFMCRASMLVMSSRYEGFGNVLAEALACGTPVVSTDCPYGPAEILEDGKFGRLVPVEDADALAEAMLATLDAFRDAARLRRRGRFFSARKAADQYHLFFQEVLNARDAAV